MFRNYLHYVFLDFVFFILLLFFKNSRKKLLKKRRKLFGDRGNGSFIVPDGSLQVIKIGRTLSDAPCITIFIQLEESNLFLSQGTRSQFPAYCLFSGIYESLIYTVLRHQLLMCSLLCNSSFINYYYLICMTNSL